MNKNISDDELIDEVVERVKKGDIKSEMVYQYNEDRMVFRLKGTKGGVEFYHNSWDIKKSARYRQNYENYCLPIIEEKKQRENNKKIEILKTKINHDQN